MRTHDILKFWFEEITAERHCNQRGQHSARLSIWETLVFH